MSYAGVSPSVHPLLRGPTTFYECNGSCRGNGTPDVAATDLLKKTTPFGDKILGALLISATYDVADLNFIAFGEVAAH